MISPGEIPHIYPQILPALVTILSCFFILITVTKKGSAQPRLRLLGILCLIAVVYNLIYAGFLINGWSSFPSTVKRLIFPVAFFFIPLSIHFCRTITEGKLIKRLTSLFYGIALMLMAVTWWNDSMAVTAFSVFAFMGLIICAFSLSKAPRSTAGSWLMLSGITSLLALVALHPFSNPSIDPLTFEFIPVALLSLGALLNREDIRKKDLIPWFIISIIMTPLVCDIAIIALNIQTMSLGDIAKDIISFGLVKILAIVLCMGLAFFSFTRKEEKTEGTLLFIICTLAALVNLVDIMALLPGALVPQIILLNDLFFAVSVGTTVHLIYRISRKPVTIAVPLFYGMSGILMILLFAGALPWSGERIDGNYHTLLIATLLAALAQGMSVLWKTWQIETDPIRKKVLYLFFLGAASAVFFQIFDLFNSIGISLLQIHEMQVISLVIIAYGLTYEDLLTISGTNKRELLATGLKTLIIILYLALVPVMVWLFKEYGPDHVIARIIPYGIPPLLSFICAAFLSLFVLGLEQNRLEAILFSLICFCYTMLNLDITLVAIIPDIHLALQVSRLDHLFLTLIMLGVNLHFIYLITEKKTGWWVVYLGYATGLIMAPLSQTHYYYQGMYTYYWGYFARKAILFDIMSVLWLAALVYGIFLLYQGVRKTDTLRRTTVRRVLTAFLILAGLSISNIPTINGVEIYPMGTFAFIGLIYLAYGLFKFNLRTALQDIRSFIYALGLIAFLLCIGMLPSLILPAEDRTLSLTLGIITVVLSYRLFARVWDVVLELFIRNERGKLGHEYYSLTEDLSRIHHLKEIHQALKEWFFRVFSGRCCALILIKEDRSSGYGWNAWNPLTSAGIFDKVDPTPKGEFLLRMDTEHPLIRISHKIKSMVYGNMLTKLLSGLSENDRGDNLFRYIDMLIPIRSGDRTVALLLLGRKNDGSAYRRAEIDLVHSVSLALGPYVENALLLESLESEVEKRTKDLNTTLVEATLKEKEISQRNEVILRQNQIMSALLETSAKIHQLEDLEELFSFTLSQLRSLFPDFCGGILLKDTKRSILEASAFIGVTETEQRIILENKYRITDPAIDTILCDEMAFEGTQAAENPSLWRVFPLQDKAERESGHMILKGKDLDGPAGEIVTLFIGQISAVIQNKLLMAHLEKMASTDGLTSIYNRSFLDQELDRVIKLAQRYKSMWFSLMVIDVNGLKYINDTYGHGVGDEVIVKVAGLLMSVCRETDIVSRIGGDEFAVLMPSTNRSQSEILHSRIRRGEKALQVLLILPDGTHTRIPINISIGLASSDETDPSEVMKRADDLMYIDKQRFYAGKKPSPSPSLLHEEFEN